MDQGDHRRERTPARVFADLSPEELAQLSPADFAAYTRQALAQPELSEDDVALSVATVGRFGRALLELVETAETALDAPPERCRPS